MRYRVAIPGSYGGMNLGDEAILEVILKQLRASVAMPTIAELNVGKLCAFLDESWDLRKETKKHLDKTVPTLREKAEKTNQIVCDLLKSLKTL